MITTTTTTTTTTTSNMHKCLTGILTYLFLTGCVPAHDGSWRIIFEEDFKKLGLFNFNFKQSLMDKEREPQIQRVLSCFPPDEQEIIKQIDAKQRKANLAEGFEHPYYARSGGGNCTVEEWGFPTIYDWPLPNIKLLIKHVYKDTNVSKKTKKLIQEFLIPVYGVRSGYGAPMQESIAVPKTAGYKPPMPDKITGDGQRRTPSLARASNDPNGPPTYYHPAESAGVSSTTMALLLIEQFEDNQNPDAIPFLRSLQETGFQVASSARYDAGRGVDAIAVVIERLEKLKNPKSQYYPESP